jgi:hypothetical protein
MAHSTETLPDESFGWNAVQTKIPLALRKRIITYTTSFIGKRIWPIIFENIPTGIGNIILIPSMGPNTLPLHAATDALGLPLNSQLRFSYLPSIRSYDPITNSRFETMAQIVDPTEDLFFAHEEAKGEAFVFVTPIKFTFIPGNKQFHARY